MCVRRRHIAVRPETWLPGANSGECMLEHMDSVSVQIEPDFRPGFLHGAKK